jgi:carbon-monoxide dehydrogenase medium subunit
MLTKWRAFYKIRKMLLPEFEYYNPDTIEEVFMLLASLGRKADLLAGGTDLIPELKDRIRKTDALISLKKIKDLKGIHYTRKEKLSIGALTTLSELIASPGIPSEFSPIKEAASTLASPPIRSMATIGGNIVSAVPSADMPPILIALNADITLISKKKTRTAPLEDFFTGPRETILKQDEVLKSIDVPFPESGTGACYLKQGKRGCLACAVTGVAVLLTMEKDICRSARIVLGAVAETPLFIEEASKVLAGRKLDDKAAQVAAEMASNLCCPINDLRAPADYRREIVRILTMRAIEKAKERAWSG